MLILLIAVPCKKIGINEHSNYPTKTSFDKEKFMTGATCGAGSVHPSGAPEITPSFWWGSCCLFFSFIFCVNCTIVCLFVLFIFSHGVVSLFSIYEFCCPSGIFRPLLWWHKSFMVSMNITLKSNSEDLLCLYLKPQLHKIPYKQQYIAGSSVYSTNYPLDLTAAKEGLQKYCETVVLLLTICVFWKTL